MQPKKDQKKDGITGRLVVVVKQAKLTRDTEVFLKMDPYCILTCGKTERKTQVHERGGKKPKWNQQFLFDIRDEKELVITVMDRDLVDDDKVGEGRINLESLKKKGRIIDEWYLIEYKKKPSGQVQLDIEYYPVEFKEKSNEEKYEKECGEVQKDHKELFKRLTQQTNDPGFNQPMMNPYGHQATFNPYNQQTTYNYGQQQPQQYYSQQYSNDPYSLQQQQQQQYYMQQQQPGYDYGMYGQPNSNYPVGYPNQQPPY